MQLRLEMDWYQRLMTPNNQRRIVGLKVIILIWELQKSKANNLAVEMNQPRNDNIIASDVEVENGVPLVTVSKALMSMVDRY